jgi:hypothetical protein
MSVYILTCILLTFSYIRMYWDGEKSRFGDFDRYEHFVVGMPSVCMYVRASTVTRNMSSVPQYIRHRLVLGECEHK